MNNKVLWSALIVVIIANLSVYALNKREQKIIYEDREIILSDSFINDENRLYVPLRELCEKMGYVVTWNTKTQSAHITVKGSTILDPVVKEGQIERFNASLNTSASGVLENGSEYSFISENNFADPDYIMDYSKFAEDSSFNLNYSIGTVISSAETAVKYTQLILNEYNHKRYYRVFFDRRHNAWIVLSEPTQNFTYLPIGLVIDAYDGRIICRLSGGWNNVNPEIEQIYGASDL